METQKVSKEERLEKEMKTLLKRMRNENSALNKILSGISPDTDPKTIPSEITEETGKKHKK
jgi:hypothetical protein